MNQSGLNRAVKHVSDLLSNDVYLNDYLKSCVDEVHIEDIDNDDDQKSFLLRTYFLSKILLRVLDKEHFVSIAMEQEIIMRLTIINSDNRDMNTTEHTLSNGDTLVIDPNEVFKDMVENLGTDDDLYIAYQDLVQRGLV